jgi:hypothetical protein
MDTGFKLNIYYPIEFDDDIGHVEKYNMFVTILMNHSDGL